MTINVEKHEILLTYNNLLSASPLPELRASLPTGIHDSIE